MDCRVLAFMKMLRILAHLSESLPRLFPHLFNKYLLITYKWQAVLGMKNIKMDKIKPLFHSSGEKGLELMKTAGIKGGSVVPLRANGMLRSN